MPFQLKLLLFSHLDNLSLFSKSYKFSMAMIFSFLPMQLFYFWLPNIYALQIIGTVPIFLIDFLSIKTALTKNKFCFLKKLKVVYCFMNYLQLKVILLFLVYSLFKKTIFKRQNYIKKNCH